MAFTDRPLTSEERIEITRQLGIGLRQVGADRAVAPSQGKLQELIGKAVDGYRNMRKPLNAEMLESLAQSLGCLWGQVICDEFGWTWTLLKKDGGDEDCVVVTPNRSHVVFPLQYIHDLLAGKNTESDTRALYRRILTGQIPGATDHAYLTL